MSAGQQPDDIGARFIANVTAYLADLDAAIGGTGPADGAD